MEGSVLFRCTVVAVLWAARLELTDSNGVGLIEPENLTGPQLDDRLRIPKLLAIQLDAALFDEAAHVSA